MLRFLTIIFTIFFYQANGQEWDSLNTKSLNFYNEGQFSDAIVYSNKALEVAKLEFGELSLPYIISLSNRSNAQLQKSELYNALKGFKKITKLSFELYKLPHALQVESVIELSKTFTQLATYDSAEYYVQLGDYLIQNISTLNPAHYDTAIIRINDAFIQLNASRAAILHRKGQTKQAIKVLVLEKQTIESIYKDKAFEQPEYAKLINNLASYYTQVQDIDKSIEYSKKYQQLVNTSENVLDQIHAYQNLASAYRLAESDSARYFWDLSLELLNGSAYEGQNIHSSILNNLAEMALSHEEYSNSIALLTLALDYQSKKQVLNPNLHKTTLFNLAEAYRWSKQYAKADSIYESLITDLIEDVAHNFTFLSDTEKMSFYDAHIDFIDGFASFGLEVSGLLPLQSSETPYISQDIFGRLYNLQLQTKAIILNASKRMKSSILSSGDTTLVSIYTLWETRKSQLAQALLNEGLSDNEFQNLKYKIEENEKWLTANSRRFQSGFVFDTTDWRDIQKSLKPNEAAVEMIRLIDGLVYGALIITAQTNQQPAMAVVMSTRSKGLDNEFFKNYKNSITLRIKDTLSYNTYWKPIKNKILEHMTNHKMPERIYFSNDGIYNQINLNTLLNPENGQFIIDETELVVVTNTKELVKYRSTSFNKRAVLVGNPSFSTSENGFKKFKELPGTLKEVTSINQVLSNKDWQVKLLVADDAAEDQIKDISNASILHIASHGFFKEAGNAQSLAETMIQSGIALAGANNEAMNNEDGILTAFEVLSMDLDSTQLVVLSACETGLGSMGQSEGIYGLQRAMRVAGADNIVMSLWKVDDISTQKMMSAFYEEWLLTGNMHLAFRNAQIKLREKYPQPYHWGAFILAGK